MRTTIAMTDGQYISAVLLAVADRIGTTKTRRWHLSNPGHAERLILRERRYLADSNHVVECAVRVAEIAASDDEQAVAAWNAKWMPKELQG